MVVNEVKSRECCASAPITMGKGGGCSPPRSSEHSREDQLLSEIGMARREAVAGKLLLASWQDKVVWCLWRSMSSLQEGHLTWAFLVEACCTGPCACASHCWAHTLQPGKPGCPRAPAPLQEKPLQWGACALQPESNPACRNWRKACTARKT